MTVHLVKLCVGASTVEDLIQRQALHRGGSGDGSYAHVTRMWPRREAELLSGGSLYWVFKGMILARQRVLGLEEIPSEDGKPRCGIVLDPAIIRTEARPRRPFQGWRYLSPEDAPADLRAGNTADTALPPGLSAALAEIGVLES